MLGPAWNAGSWFVGSPLWEAGVTPAQFCLKTAGLCWSTSYSSTIPALTSIKKKGTKAVTGAVPFQKVHFCT